MKYLKKFNERKEHTPIDLIKDIFVELEDEGFNVDYINTDKFGLEVVITILGNSGYTINSKGVKLFNIDLVLETLKVFIRHFSKDDVKIIAGDGEITFELFDYLKTENIEDIKELSRSHLNTKDKDTKGKIDLEKLTFVVVQLKK